MFTADKGWRTARIVRLDDKSGQVQVQYTSARNGRDHLYWVHFDDVEECAPLYTHSRSSKRNKRASMRAGGTPLNNLETRARRNTDEEDDEKAADPADLIHLPANRSRGERSPYGGDPAKHKMQLNRLQFEAGRTLPASHENGNSSRKVQFASTRESGRGALVSFLLCFKATVFPPPRCGPNDKSRSFGRHRASEEWEK